jgi:hypothetical protein
MTGIVVLHRRYIGFAPLTRRFAGLTNEPYVVQEGGHPWPFGCERRRQAALSEHRAHNLRDWFVAKPRMKSSTQVLALRSLLALEAIGAIPICVARRVVAAMAVSKTVGSITVVLSVVK